MEQKEYYEARFYVKEKDGRAQINFGTKYPNIFENREELIAVLDIDTGILLIENKKKVIRKGLENAVIRNTPKT